MIQEATIVWHRHRPPIYEWLKAEDCTNLLAFFENMTRAVRDNLTLWYEAVQFLETVILPSCFIHSVAIVRLLCVFIAHVLCECMLFTDLSLARVFN